MVYVFDENYSPLLADALDLLERGNVGKGKHVAEVWHILKLAQDLNIKPSNSGKSFTDEEVIQIVGRKKGIIFTQDGDFKRIKHFGHLYKQHNVGVVYFNTVLENRGYWNMVTYMISKWNDLKTILQNESPPFCYHVNRQGIHNYPF